MVIEYFGIYLDSRMTLSHHVDFVLKQLSTLTYIFYYSNKSITYIDQIRTYLTLQN